MNELLKKGLGWVTGLEWQTLLLKTGLVVAMIAIIYAWGRGDGKEACQKEHTKEAKAQVREIQMFVPIVDRQTVRTAERNARVERAQEVYNDEVDKRRRPAECDLTDDELRSFQDLVKG